MLQVQRIQLRSVSKYIVADVWAKETALSFSVSRYHSLDTLYHFLVQKLLKSHACLHLKSSPPLPLPSPPLPSPLPSPSEAEALLSSTAPSSSAQSQRKAPTYLTPDVGVASASPAPTRRSTRSKRGRGTSGCGFVEEVEDDPAIMVKKRPYPNRK